MNSFEDIASTAQEARENSVGWMLKVLSNTMSTEMNRELKHLDLNVSQFAMLMSLSEQQGMTQTEIGKKIAMPGYATTRAIDSLEKNGYVKRQKDERSRRSHRIYLTERSIDVIPELNDIRHKLNGELLSVFTETEREEFTDLLKKLVAFKLSD